LSLMKTKRLFKGILLLCAGFGLFSVADHSLMAQPGPKVWRLDGNNNATSADWIGPNAPFQDFRVRLNLQEVIRFKPNSNIGFGDFSALTPQSRLHVHQPNTSGACMQFTNVNTGAGSNTNGFRLGLTSSQQGELTSELGEIIIGNTVSGNFSTIKVGIGTQSPNFMLDVAGIINSSTHYRIGGNRVLSAPGSNNVFVGFGSGTANTGGSINTFVGQAAGNQNTVGGANTFVGGAAGNSNIAGTNNSFFGRSAGATNKASENTFIGSRAGISNDNGFMNTFLGCFAGLAHTTGDLNVYVGTRADGVDGLTNSSAIGARSFVGASDCLVLGSILGVNGAGASSRVGIGVTDPDKKLVINSEAADESGLRFTQLNDGSTTIFANPNNVALGVDGSGNVVLVAGTIGATGPTGVDGATGATGVDGTNGIDGVTGATGTTGTDGIDGATGPTGATGVTGTTGTDGIDGADGKSVVTKVSAASITDCPNGGEKIEFFRDDNNDGIHQITETTLLGTSFSCTGDDGATGPQGPAGSGGALGDEIQFNDGTGNHASNPKFVWDDANERLGVGTSTPAKKLEIVTPSNFDGVVLKRSTGSVAAEMILHNSFGGYLKLSDDVGANEVSFNDPNTAKDFLNTSYNFGIGTSTPTKKVEIIALPNNDGIVLKRSTGSVAVEMLLHNNFGGYIKLSDAVGTNEVSFNDPNTAKDFINTGYNFGIGTPNPLCKLDVNGAVCSFGVDVQSDLAIKKNITTLTNSLEKIQQLRGVNFEWDMDSLPDSLFMEGTQIGFIAQEVDTVLPEVVHQSDSGIYSLSYSRIVPVLVEAIKEQQQLIDDLEDPNNDSIVAELQTINNRLDVIEACINSLPQGLCGGNTMNKNGGSQDPGDINNNERVLPKGDELDRLPELFQNTPNPFSKNTKIRYRIPETAGNGALYIYDLQGKQVRMFDNLDRGNGSVTVSGRELYAGMFIYTLIVDGKDVGTKRMILTE